MRDQGRHDDPASSLFDTASKMAKQLGLYEHSLSEILNDKSDWSFTIKIQSLMEIALNHLLSERISVLPLYEHGAAQSALSDFITRLPVSGRTGKVRLARGLHLTGRFVLDLIERLTEIRNFYAHDVRNVNVSIDQYIFDNKKEAQSRFHKAFIPEYERNPDVVAEYPKEAYRLYIFLAVCAALGFIENSLKPRATLLTGATPASDAEN